jgi:nitrate reductase molybdenum cofactor assembly chaperone NarJ/NarW
MAKTFKVLSALLAYPTAELQQATGELAAVLDAEALVTSRIRRQLQTLIDEIAAGDIYDLQERYTLLFDRTRSLSLHLFEHVHGESRDRGQAMIDLKAMYETSGLLVSANELPDFLPLFLEYLSTRPAAEACAALGQPAHILAALAERLRKRGSAYEAVFRALGALAAAKPKPEDVAILMQEPDPDPLDLAALDAAWEDEPVTFGPGAASCKDGLVARMRAARRPAADIPSQGGSNA